MLEKLDPKVTEEVVRFALARHGNDPEWKKRIGRLSFGSIAKLHLREFVKATEYKTTGGKENGEDGIIEQCKTNGYSSRVCEHGTKCCDVQHIKEGNK